MSWTYDSLWQKTKIYAQRAMDEDRDGPLFPFWAVLALELLGRATLAKVHPALLADPREPENTMYAFGYSTTNVPKSIPSKALFSRCRTIITDFIEDDYRFCMSMTERRNQELHTGTPAFEDLPTRLWLANYFRVCKLLLSFQERSLVDLFGAEEATAAETMISAAEQKIISKVRKIIADANAKFQALDKSEQEDRKKGGGQMAALELGTFGKLVQCPACEAQALLLGEKIRAREPKLENEVLIRDFVVLPTKFHCYSCELRIEGHDNLHAVELGGQFVTQESYDPVQYYSTNSDADDYMDYDYGNE